MNQMLGLLFALFAALAWGSWMSPSKLVKLNDIQFLMFSSFFIFIGSLVLFLISRQTFTITMKDIGFSAFAGITWTIGFGLALLAVKHIGLGKGYAIWSGAQALVAVGIGVILFKELSGLTSFQKIQTVIGVLLIIVGIGLVSLVRS